MSDRMAKRPHFTAWTVMCLLAALASEAVRLIAG